MGAAAAEGTADRFHLLAYPEPARTFTEALPLGNGRLGAMCYGGAGRDLIRLNDGTAWSGSPASELAVPPQDPARNAAGLLRARQLISEGRHQAAERCLAGTAQPYTQAYLPFADLLLRVGDGARIPDAGTYRRTLDLRTATHTHTYRVDGNRIRRRVFVSAVHGVLAVELEADQPVELAVELRSQLRVLTADSSACPAAPPDSAGDRSYGECGLALVLPSDVAPRHASRDAGVSYGGPALFGAVVLDVEHDGVHTTAAGGTLSAAGVRRASIFLATDTTFTGIGAEPRGTAPDAAAAAKRRLRAARQAGMAAVRSQHLAEHHRLYGRAALALAPMPVSGPAGQDSAGQDLNGQDSAGLDLNGQDSGAGAAAADVPELIRTPQAAPQLAALLFNYGRYLLLSCSRPGSLPATLQGLWNEELQAPWSSNYTLNINTEMNYWAAETANLSECSEPLFDLIDALARTGRATAQRIYGLPGWVAHHNTDAWAFSAPVAGDAAWSLWPLAPAWLSTHLAEHLRFGAAAPDFAAARAWPVIRSACSFYLGWLQRMPDGFLGTRPSTSPENHFQTADGPAAAGSSSTADITMIRQLFRDALELGPAGDPLLGDIGAALALLPPIPVTDAGLVSEWAEDFVLPEPAHRHVSHLWFAYPGREELPPALAAAVSHSLDERGDDSTGWSLVWKMALRARLREPEAVGRLLPLVLRSAESNAVGSQWAGGLYQNLFAAHPPFQVDGNLGYVAAAAQCLVQSRKAPGGPDGPGETPWIIVLLPAVPPQWRSGGTVHGLVLAPGVVAGLEWRGNDAAGLVLVRAALRARTETAAGKFLLEFDGTLCPVRIGTGADTVVTAAHFS